MVASGYVLIGNKAVEIVTDAVRLPRIPPCALTTLPMGHLLAIPTSHQQPNWPQYVRFGTPGSQISMFPLSSACHYKWAQWGMI